jgi:hypothetical protein
VGVGSDDKLDPGNEAVIGTGSFDDQLAPLQCREDMDATLGDIFNMYWGYKR